MKKIFFMLSLVLILTLTSVPVFAQTTNDIVIAIDSVKVNFDEESGSPFVDENYRTLVPFRKALEAYGAEVEWNAEANTAVAVKGDIKIEVPIGESYIIINGQQKSNDTKALLVNGRTYLPIRAVIEAFGSSVEWDQNLKTVVITTEPVDAKAIFLAASNKSYDWKNYNANVAMNMSIPVKDDAGSVQEMNMNMKMFMTIFMEPALKAKVNANLLMSSMGQEVVIPIMDMYMTTDDSSITQYMGMNDQAGNKTWLKTTMKNDMFGDLFKYNKDAINKNKELTEKYIKDVKYFGKYTEDNKTLLRMKYTMSGDIYKDIFGQYVEEASTSTDEQVQMTLDMIKSLANGSIGDLSCIVYVDEATGELVKYEMDLGSIISSMMTSMTDLLKDVPADELEMLKNMKATMYMEVLDINKAESFEIPEEALKAKEMTEMLKELEQQP